MKMGDQLADKESINQFFLIVMGSIVYLMQMGFGFLEAGAVRSKNVTNILMKNILDSAIAALGYWVCGFAFAYGTNSNPFISYSNFLLIGVDDDQSAYWFFQYVFAATAATIVSGAMAERTNFMAYVVYSIVLTTVVYPVVTHWVWAENGWLIASCPWDGVNYIDFAGSSAVHCVGGIAALIGAIVVGPRKGFHNVFAQKNQRIKGEDQQLNKLSNNYSKTFIAARRLFQVIPCPLLAWVPSSCFSVSLPSMEDHSYTFRRLVMAKLWAKQ